MLTSNHTLYLPTYLYPREKAKETRNNNNNPADPLPPKQVYHPVGYLGRYIIYALFLFPFSIPTSASFSPSSSFTASYLNIVSTVGTVRTCILIMSDLVSMHVVIRASSRDRASYQSAWPTITATPTYICT
ncbi:uncharacterized protein F4822DRAFT_421632 [Hypoxylon trugodes]|uniref:uncharacterized protein n=1 Tax=Hypoxylon trugodes TaxID=326681 RepID=UPI00219DA1C0|nr:uncharacterized protein F4822DRAFT_421632 [Hypoxylon trugodes]KAI1382939.1 hypothetical protein F4822DRAFT_421632 [Hypoxylon trugodes]